MNPSFYDALAQRHFAYVDNAFRPNLYRGLVDHFSKLIDRELLKAAGTGTLSQYEINRSVRGDKIHWLQRGDTSEAIRVILQRVAKLDGGAQPGVLFIVE